MNDRYLDIKELAEYSGRCETYLRGLIRSGELKHFRETPRGKILVRASWFDDFVERRISRLEEANRQANPTLVQTADEWLARIQKVAS